MLRPQTPETLHAFQISGSAPVSHAYKCFQLDRKTETYKTTKHVYTNHCQSEQENFDIFAELELENIKFPNSILSSDLLELTELAFK